MKFPRSKFGPKIYFKLNFNYDRSSEGVIGFINVKMNLKCIKLKF